MHLAYKAALSFSVVCQVIAFKSQVSRGAVVAHPDQVKAHLGHGLAGGFQVKGKPADNGGDSTSASESLMRGPAAYLPQKGASVDVLTSDCLTR